MTFRPRKNVKESRRDFSRRLSQFHAAAPAAIKLILETVPERQLHPIVRRRVLRVEALVIRVESVNTLCLCAIGSVDQVARLREENGSTAKLAAGAALVGERLN